jgi:hypothetical protein
MTIDDPRESDTPRTTHSTNVRTNDRLAGRVTDQTTPIRNASSGARRIVDLRVDFFATYPAPSGRRTRSYEVGYSEETSGARLVYPKFESDLPAVFGGRSLRATVQRADLAHSAEANRYVPFNPPE